MHIRMKRMVFSLVIATPTGLGGAAVISAAFPFFPADARVVLAAVALMGVFAGVAFAASYQVVSRFGTRESVALTTGEGCGGPHAAFREKQSSSLVEYKYVKIYSAVHNATYGVDTYIPIFPPHLVRLFNRSLE